MMIKELHSAGTKSSTCKIVRINSYLAVDSKSTHYLIIRIKRGPLVDDDI